MTPTIAVPEDLDYLAARLHGRRSRMAEGARLDALCRIRTVPELFRTLYPAMRFQSVLDLQRHLVLELLRELSEFGANLTGAAAAILAWQRVRFQVENLKVLARGFANGTAISLLRPHLAPLPEDLELDADALVAARDLDAFVSAAPQGPLREGLDAARDVYRTYPRSFILETALDAGYLRELLRRARRLPREEQEDVRRLADQETGIFHLMLVVRGVFHYGLKPDMLSWLHVAGGALSRKQFASMLTARDLQSAAALAVGRVLDAAPPAPADAAEIEIRAWNGLLRLANAAFRRSHLGIGAVVGYTVIRRIELANLITLSEGLRLGLDPRVLRARMIPRPVGEGFHV